MNDESLSSELSALPSWNPVGTTDRDAAGPQSLYVVGIGASAGGLESLERMFGTVPSTTDLAFVIIQHLSPDFKSLMDELLARYTDIPIHRAEDGMPVEANAIYLIPPKKEMIISHGRLLLTDKDPRQPLSMPIDRFFRSLAQDAGDRAIGVILSGSGTDGSRGIRDIHDAGGYVICESKETAKFDGMPQAALDSGVVDEVLPPQEIPAALVRYLQRERSAEADGGTAGPPAAIHTVFKLLNDECGIDFSHYKPNTVSRRIQRRLSMLGVRTLSEYAERLKKDNAEVNLLYKDLLIGVTRFFRDREAFQKLQDYVIPELVDTVGEEEEIRIWVAGCATGEEPYSIAILLHERMEATGRWPKVKIFATDVHPASLDVATAGIYQRDSLADVSPERLARYFDHQKDGYHVIADLRKMIVFAAHNLINDAPFTKLNLITCRNLLIYFDPLAQKRCLSLFHFGLKTGGMLFLGTSETPGDLQDEFETIDLHWKIYRKSRDVRLATDIQLPLVGSFGVAAKPVGPPNRNLPDPSLVGAYDAILNSLVPPSLLINERRELLHCFGGAEQYLSVKGGRPSHDVLEMLDHDLRTAITGAVQRALKDNIPIRFSALCVTTEEGEQRFRVAVEPLENPRSRLRQLLIVIEPLRTPPVSESSGEPGDADMKQMSRDRIESLELELRHNKENLQTTIEELETSNEELQAANEELVTSNEELQSTNEELQSVNEELFTVNAEYQKKITELSEMTSDMDNLLASTDIGTIFLDAELCIRKFTPQIASQFHLLPQDVGRPIDGFSHSIVYPRLVDDLRRTVATSERYETEVQDQQGKWQYVRMLPYRKKNRTEGVVLTLIEITPLKRVQHDLADAVRLRDQFLAMLSHELRNPLGAILNAANVIARCAGDAGQMQAIGEVVLRQGRIMARLLDDLLDVSRVTQNKIEMKKQPISVAAIVEGAVEAVKPMIEQHAHRLSETIAPEEIRVNGDPVRLQQAVSNLLVNAAKYTPPGGHLDLNVRQEDGHVVIRISDDGVGIAPDQTDRIFDLFMQSDRTLHRSKGGMGVGLTLVRSIVEQHDGTVTARSDGHNCGSQFEIRLPRLKTSSTRRAPPQPDEMNPAAEQGVRVVIVEDQDDNREMLKTLLELEGFQVYCAENGPKGVSLIDRYQPEIALIDIGLPGLSGFEVAGLVRERLNNRKTLLVALSGYGQPTDVQAALDAGFDHHLVKPLDIGKFQALVAAKIPERSRRES